MMRRFNKKENLGITLVALVITIVVLIILAGVLINISLGNNGLFNKAKTAKEMYTNAQAQEETEIAKISNGIDDIINTRETVTSTYKIEKVNEVVGATAISVVFSKYDALYVVLSTDGWEYMTLTVPTFDLRTDHDYLLGTDFDLDGRWGTVRFSTNSVIVHELYINGEHKESEAKLAIYGIKY